MAAKGRTWFRVERDWFADPKVTELAERVGPAGVVGWFRLLGRACSSEGWFAHPLAAEVRSADLGISGEAAKKVAVALVELGLVEEDEEGCRIAAWEAYQPPMRYLTPTQRANVTNHHDVVMVSPKAVTTNERTNERTNKTNGRTNGMSSVGEVLARGAAKGGFR